MSWAEVKKINSKLDVPLDVTIGQKTDAAGSTASSSMFGWVKNIYNTLISGTYGLGAIKINTDTINKFVGKYYITPSDVIQHYIVGNEISSDGVVGNAATLVMSFVSMDTGVIRLTAALKQLSNTNLNRASIVVTKKENSGVLSDIVARTPDVMGVTYQTSYVDFKVEVGTSYYIYLSKSNGNDVGRLIYCNSLNLCYDRKQVNGMIL